MGVRAARRRAERQKISRLPPSRHTSIQKLAHEPSRGDSIPLALDQRFDKLAIEKLSSSTASQSQCSLP